MAKFECANRYRDESQRFWNLYQCERKAKVWQKKGSAHDPKYMSLAKHSDGFCLHKNLVDCHQNLFQNLFNLKSGLFNTSRCKY